MLNSVILLLCRQWQFMSLSFTYLNIANQTCTETNQGSHKACYEKVKSPLLNGKKLSFSYMLSVMDAGNFISRSLDQQSRRLSVNFLSCCPIIYNETRPMYFCSIIIGTGCHCTAVDPFF